MKTLVLTLFLVSRLAFSAEISIADTAEAVVRSFAADSRIKDLRDDLDLLFKGFSAQEREAWDQYWNRLQVGQLNLEAVDLQIAAQPAGTPEALLKPLSDLKFKFLEGLFEDLEGLEKLTAARAKKQGFKPVDNGEKQAHKLTLEKGKKQFTLTFFPAGNIWAELIDETGPMALETDLRKLFPAGSTFPWRQGDSKITNTVFLQLTPGVSDYELKAGIYDDTADALMESLQVGGEYSDSLFEVEKGVKKAGATLRSHKDEISIKRLKEQQ
ncbi:hypothetical protein K2X33_10280 [bacterium]|nr:hypothetical protein [bacterium]